jgi:DNA-directed RNA polymerase specialized sigma24 family protein
MPPDSRADEQLVEAYRSGQQSALDILFSRYLTRILTWLCGKSFFYKDKDYLAEVRDEILLKVCQGIRKDPKDGGFYSQGPGSFQAWLRTITELECLNADKKRRHLHIPFSQAFPTPTGSDDESTSFEDNIIFKMSSEPDETEYARMKLARAFKGLEPEEIALLQLSVRMKYKDIIKLQEFSKYKSVATLRDKVYNIMEKIRKKKEEHE